MVKYWQIKYILVFILYLYFFLIYIILKTYRNINIYILFILLRILSNDFKMDIFFLILISK